MVKYIYIIINQEHDGWCVWKCGNNPHSTDGNGVACGIWQTVGDTMGTCGDIFIYIYKDMYVYIYMYVCGLAGLIGYLGDWYVWKHGENDDCGPVGIISSLGRVTTLTFTLFTYVT